MSWFALVFSIVINFLKSHAYLAYLALFLGSYFETIVGPGFFIPGEAFFIPGSILAGAKILNIWLVSGVCLAGGVLGDSTSFFIGRKLGKKAFNEKNRYLNLTNYEKGEKFFAKYGEKGIFMARLLGPLSWITPFLSGVYGVPYRNFLLFNIPGVFVGIGQFMIVGYFFGNTYGEILAIIQKYILLIIAILILLILIYIGIKRRNKIMLKFRDFISQEKKFIFKSIVKHTIYYIVILTLLYGVILYLMFFIFEKNNNSQSPDYVFPTYQNVTDIKNNTNFLTYLSAKETDPFQPINVMIKTTSDITDIFNKINWRQNYIFSESQLSFDNFLRLTKEKFMPVSDLYLNGRVEDYAFQEVDNSAIKRQHIKLWKFAYLNDKDTTIYLGSVSYDNGIDLTHYKNFIVPLHGIDKNVDQSRDLLLSLFTKKYPQLTYNYQNWGTKIEKKNSEDKNFSTDGRILVIEL